MEPGEAHFSAKAELSSPPKPAVPALEVLEAALRHLRTTAPAVSHVGIGACHHDERCPREQRSIGHGRSEPEELSAWASRSRKALRHQPAAKLVHCRAGGFCLADAESIGEEEIFVPQ